jgi:hypothetical protein
MYHIYYVCEYIFYSVRIIVGVIAYIKFLYCLNNTNCLVFVFCLCECVYLFLSFARAYFIIGIRAVEQDRK